MILLQFTLNIASMGLAPLSTLLKLSFRGSAFEGKYEQAYHNDKDNSTIKYIVHVLQFINKAD